MKTQKGKNYKIFNYGSQKLMLGKCQEYSVGGLGSRKEHCLGYTSVSEKTPKRLIVKSIFPLKVAATLLGGSRKGAVGAQ